MMQLVSRGKTRKASRRARIIREIRKTCNCNNRSRVIVPAVSAITTKIPKGIIVIIKWVTRARADERTFNGSMRLLVFVFPIRANPKRRQKSTIEGRKPSAREWNGLEGMKISIRLKSLDFVPILELKKEALERWGKANCIAKKAVAPNAQKISIIMPPLRVIFLASLLRRLPMPAMRLTTMKGRTVICMIFTKAEAKGSKTEEDSPKNSPYKIPARKLMKIWALKDNLGMLFISTSPFP
jgi:hypothetical protein